MKTLGFGILVLLGFVLSGCQDTEHPDALIELTEYKVPAASLAFKGASMGFSTEEFKAFWTDHPELSRDEAIEAFMEHVALSGVSQKVLDPESDFSLARKKSMIRLMLAEEIEKFRGEVGAAELAEAQALNRHPKGARASHILVMSTTKEPVGARGEEIAQRVKEALPQDPDGLDLVKIQREFEMEEGLRLHVDLQLVFPFANEAFQELPSGWVGLDPAFVKAAQDLGGPGVTDPFETRFGWHVAVVHEVLPAKDLPEEDAKVLAQHASDTEIRKEKYQEFIDREKAASHYQIYPSVVRERAENKL